MSLREITFKQMLEDNFDGTCFYMAARALETICDDASVEWPAPEDRLTIDHWRFLLTPDGDLIAAAKGGFGPREPDLVWDGALWEDWHEASWICSEDDLSQAQRDLMDRVAKHCPGGLGGWS